MKPSRFGGADAPVQLAELPATSLLMAYRAAGAFTDCYTTEVPATISLREFIEAFYTSRLFKLERFLIKYLARRQTSDRAIAELAEALRNDFAVWTVERRSADQILLADQAGKTRSWLMVEPIKIGADAPATRLYFGSAVIPKIATDTGKKSIGLVFKALVGFHGMYSRALLRAARSNLFTNQTMRP